MAGPLSCLLITAFAANVVEAAVGADGEVAAGRAPVDITGPEENSLTFTLVPGAGLQLRSSTQRLALSYTPRIFYRLPNALNVDRPLLLHQVAAAQQLELDRRTTWTNTAQLSVGEVDYTATGVVFDPRVSSVVRTSVADIFRVEAQSGLRRDLSRRVRLSLDLYGEYTTPTGDSPAVAPVDPGMPPAGEPPPDLGVVGDAIPESAQISTRVALGYEMSRYDSLTAAGDVTYQWFPDTGRYLMLAPDVSWDTRLDQRTSLGVSAGIAYVVALEVTPGTDDSNSFGGTGSFRISSVVYKSRNLTATTNAGASLDWFFDPLAGTSQPRAGVDVGTNIEIGRDWLIGPNASFYTLLLGGQDSPRVDTDGDGVPDIDANFRSDATILRAEIPVRYALTPFASINFGVRAALRGRELNREDFRLGEQYEVWAFLGLTLRLGTSHDDGAWLSL